MDAYSFEKQSCQISSRLDLKRRSRFETKRHTLQKPASI